MSEGPQKSCAWIAPVIVASVLLLYPLSMGPVIRLAMMIGCTREAISIYWPMRWAMRESPAIRDAVRWNLDHFSMTVAPLPPRPEKHR